MATKRTKKIGLNILAVVLLLTAMYVFLVSQFANESWNEYKSVRWGGFILGWVLGAAAYGVNKRAARMGKSSTDESE